MPARTEPATVQQPAGPRVHGGLLDAELGAHDPATGELLDFSSSCNPEGPCPELRAALSCAPIARYPDPTASRARKALGDFVAADPAGIALGNGAAELLWTLARVLVRPPSRVLIVEPTFAEFRAAAHCAGGRIFEWRARPDRDFAIDLAAVVAAARACEAGVLYLCAPNTPAGTAVPAAAIAAAASELSAATWVLDQSFLSLSERWADAGQRFPQNVVCVRSLTKEQAIPGVRIGYLLGDPALCARVEAERPAWTTGAHAQAAAIAACGTREFVARSRAALLAARIELVAGLNALGLECAPSSTGFVLARTGDAPGLRARLLARHRIAIRDCGSFGLPEHVRLGARPAADRDRLLRALREEL
jgi:histidinol-phosphate/aromatic aminotransferase/cobyric acid decarboxylase-like protein